MGADEIFQEIRRKREETAKLIEKFNLRLRNAREVAIKTKNGELMAIQPVQKGARIDVGKQETLLNIIFSSREQGGDKDKREKSWPIDEIEEIRVS